MIQVVPKEEECKSVAVPESAGKLLHDRLNEPQITQISQKQEKLPPGVTELLDEVHDRSMPLKICVGCVICEMLCL